jgi:hypothetical protein
VTAEELAQSLTTYGAGLQAELALLHQLEGLALAQHEASAANDLDRLTAIGDERTRLMTALVRIEADLKPVREIIAAHLSVVRHLPFFEDTLVRHRQAGDLVARILDSDRQLLTQLQAAEQARREAAQAIEAGEVTLAAYRRVIAPSVASVGLLDRRG